MTIKTEKNIPVPPVNRSKRGRPSLYPFASMEVGDSFYVALPRSGVKRPKHVLQCAVMYGKRHGQKFLSRKMASGIRIWRIA